MKILAIKLRAIGDAVMFTSSLTALKQKYPEAQIDVLALNVNEAVLRHHKDIDKLHTISKHSGWGLIKKLIQLRSQSYDLALGFHASSSLCKFINLLGAKQYILHHHSRTHTPKASDKQLEKPGFLQNALLRDYEILKCLDINTEPLPTSLYISDDEKMWARKKLLNTGVNLEKETLALLPGASIETKHYDIESWKDIFKSLKDKQTSAVVLVDKELSEKWNLADICKEYEIPLIDNVNLREFMCLISQCQKSICMDSSSFHFSVAFGLKTACLFGPTCVGDWHPYDKQIHSLFRLDVDCRDEGPRDQEQFQYCTLSTCSHKSCMKHDSQKILNAII